ncbi:MAG: M23 family metallopeptidase [Gammaproteobacteria bacterium]|uniref:M23 family metallopeptidase n=1 Tax=Pseudomaricurvus alcaniphilus TaxID=1166482 RepID=UPI00140D1711|nr:M23 family metallopeptidase [Pseudomaricurvus alcaniphilus]MBR9909068.1 M23 family metallopeptidase [Gammaproteobacteria bacterium]NHN38113.1 M23 family metallopeptidase [Pseudomaricurvus alcaniphilus]
MKIILVGKHHGRSRSFTLSGWTRSLLSVCLLGIPFGLGVLTSAQFEGQDPDGFLTEDVAKSWGKALAEQNSRVATTRQNAEEKLAALTLRLAELQAKVLRLDALGERLTSIAKLDEGEFDFSQPPAVGGPETAELGEAYLAPDFIQVIDQLTEQIADRKLQLETLETLLARRKIQEDVFLAGRPVKKGWMSSRFGRRTDPFKGHVAWHNGVDFAGKLGSDVISVASGVVTWSGERSGYGQMVEVNHGNGFSTRYAHNSENLVNVGDVIKKGQVLALMGSSGRSTGPHVHFEVYKHGRAVDPASYIHRTIR